MTDKKNMRYTYQIYKISSDYCDKFYIGSTRDFTTRKSKHKGACNNPNAGNHNTKVYRTIRENGGWESFRMTCIEVMENTTKLEAEIKEEQWRMQLKATLNDRMVTRGYMTKAEYGKQYREEHKDHIKEQRKQYRLENIDHYKQYREENREHYKEYNKEYNKKHYEEHKEHIKEHNKKYREEHKDYFKEYAKQYREENKEKLRAIENQKHDCQCGGKYTYTNKKRHLETIKHQQYLDTLGKSI